MFGAGVDVRSTATAGASNKNGVKARNSPRTWLDMDQGMVLVAKLHAFPAVYSWHTSANVIFLTLCSW